MVTKKNRSRAEVYDRLYAIAHKLLQRHDPCHNCIVNNCFNDGPERCCRGCPHFNNGCTVKALYCKLWLCGKTGHIQLQRRLRRLKRIAEKYDLLVARGSRKESLEFGEQLAWPNNWWLYEHDFAGTSRADSHKLLRSAI